jgi:uncharacterized membrane protein
VSVVALRLRWALALSMGINLSLLAFGGARWLHRGEAREHAGLHEHSARGGLGPLLGPPSPELRGQHQALSEARRNVGLALEAEPFDVQKLTAALATLRSTTSRSQELLHQKLVERAGQMPAAERSRLARSRFVRELPPVPPDRP